jgi:hypothetical protein
MKHVCLECGYELQKHIEEVGGYIPCEYCSLRQRLTLAESAFKELRSADQQSLKEALAEELEEIKRVNKLQAALSELYALVKGECPSLLNEDSGGDGELDLTVSELLEQLRTGQ